MKIMKIIDGLIARTGPLLLVVSLSMLLSASFFWNGDKLTPDRLAVLLLALVPMLIGTYLTVYRWKQESKLQKTQEDQEEILELLKEISSDAVRLTADAAEAARIETKHRHRLETIDRLAELVNRYLSGRTT